MHYPVKLNELLCDQCPWAGCNYNYNGVCESSNINKLVKEGEIISDFACESVSVPDHICEYCGTPIQNGKCPRECFDDSVQEVKEVNNGK